MPINASNRPDDRFGYSVYAGVLFATPEQRRAVQDLRTLIRPRRAMLPAHVTVLGTFCDIPSLDEIKRCIREVAARHGQVEVRIEGEGVHIFKDAAGFGIVKTPALTAIYEDLRAIVHPLVTDAYGYDTKGYMPHLTLWQECPPENMLLAERLGREISLGRGFLARDIALVGRAGPAHGGEWVTIESFPVKTLFERR
jgi:2'-5' RNA ligase